MNPDGTTDQTLQERIGTARVARFFLRLYALQLKVPADAQTRYTLVESKFSGVDSIYNLSVKVRGRFAHRRLTVGQLGYRSASKSLCYKVVFDDPLVIKIPSVPIATFQEYLKSLNRQRLIVDRYDADKRIVAPGVAPFFKCTQLLEGVFASSSGQSENRGIRWLEAHPEYHQYLKIGDGFVFLMDLSTHAFLADEIHRIHDVRTALTDEIVNQPHVLGDFHGFENRYGRNRERVYFIMNSVWAEYEKKARQLAREAGIRPRTIYEQRQWLSGQLAGLSPEYPGDAQPAFVAALEAALTEVLGKHRKAVEAYRQTVRAYVRRVAFSKNSAKIRGLIISLLDLLAWLDKSQLAIRDLKPDNLFIAGDADTYSNLTADPQKYYLGLIDIETAIGLTSGDPAQPLLGGTPSYATLSQFYPNTILHRVYPDLSLILHLQDWYAVVVMTYETVTGHQLFAKTRKLLFDIKALSRRIQSGAGGPEIAYCGSNYVFWHRAGEEFERNIQAKKNRLETVIIEPSDAAKDMMFRYAGKQLEQVSMSAESVLRQNERLLKQTADSNLATADRKAVSRFRQQLERKTRVSARPSNKHERILDIVRYLEGARLISESLAEGLADLAVPGGELSAHSLMKLMFYTVAGGMQTPHSGRNQEREETMREEGTDCPG